MRKATMTGMFALVAVGVYYLYRNRYEVQKFLESQGIRVPVDTAGFKNTVQSVRAKVVGRGKETIEHVKEGTSQQAG